VGYTPEEHYADPGLVYRNIHPDDIPIYESVFSDLAEPAGPRRYCIIRYLHKDGHIKHVEMRMSPIFDERGNLISIEGIARDISQHIIARERLSELTARLTQAHEEERRRVAYELHDEIGQSLTVVKMRLRMAENALPDDAEQSKDKLGALSALVDETLQNVRSLSHELRPPLLDEMGWEPALAGLCDSLSQRTRLPVIFKHEGSKRRLAPDVELVAYRVVQEALTNIVRHANASQAVVSSALSEESLRITVEDDGVGFNIDYLDESETPDLGLGLLGMQERVDAVGGKLLIQSQPGEGTRVNVQLPSKEREI
jgi:PAS domain S-box-containing protein